MWRKLIPAQKEVRHATWNHFGHKRTWETMRRYVALDLGEASQPDQPPPDITQADAQRLVAQAHGFESWQALTDFVRALPENRSSIAAKPLNLFTSDSNDGRHTVQRSHDWESVFGWLREKQATGMDANGQMTDDILKRLSRFDHMTALDLNGSSQVTDAGLRCLANMPHLQDLDLSGTGISDHGLEVLRELKDLAKVKLAWTRISDAGAVHLRQCEHLERADLSATPTGDGAIQALTGKVRLRHVRSGNGVTNAGLALLHQFPVFKTWQGGEPTMSLLDFEAGPNYLALRGSFTDEGFAKLAGLNGLFALNVDDSNLAITSAGLAALVDLPNLGWLAFDAKDDTMSYIASMPKLRFLMCQDTVAGDDGFVALSRSGSIEYLWGRRCYNLTARGFRALATMPRLRALSVSCKNVNDEGLSALPTFPALRELMPMDVPDDGFRHVGKCEQLESLVLKYCRETSDVATEHIATLRKLKKYFASYTRITDRSMEILSQMPSLEEMTFYGCPGVTNAGVMTLARLPGLGNLDVSGQNITSACAAAFPAHVKVRVSPL